MDIQIKETKIWRDDITDPNYGCYIVGASFVSFLLLSKAVEYFTPPFAKKSSRTAWRWKNILISFIHSTVSSIWAICCFYQEPDLCKELITTYTLLAHSLAAFSVGYFIHDFIDMLVYEKKQSFELFGHHIVVVFCFMVAILTRNYVGYANVALIAEFNSIFLHLRQLLQIKGMSKFNPLYRLNSLVNLATFIVFRILLLSWMTRWIVINKDSVPLVFYTIGSVGLAVMVCMNIILFYRLLRSDFISVKDTNSSVKDTDCSKKAVD